MSLLRASPGDDIVALIRGATGESVVVVVEPGRDALALALAEAAIAPLAMECAPGMRVNAVLAGGEARDVEAVAAFLDTAGSTTGQIVRVG